MSNRMKTPSTINLSKEHLPLEKGDRYVALPGTAFHQWLSTYEILSLKENDVEYEGKVLRLDEVHPCGAYEFVVVEGQRNV